MFFVFIGYILIQSNANNIMAILHISYWIINKNYLISTSN